MKRVSGTVLILAVYSVVVLALALVRLRSATDDGGSADALPDMIVMVALSVGPAWIAEWLLRRYRPAKMLSEQIGLLTRRRRELNRGVQRADAFLTGHARTQAAWDDAERRLRAEYATAHAARTAERRSLPSTPGSSTPASSTP